MNEKAKGIVWPGTFVHADDHRPNFNKHEMPPGQKDKLRYPTVEEIENAICKMEETHGAHRPVAMTFGSFGGELCCLPLFSDDDDLMTKEDQKNFYQELKESIKGETICNGAGGIGNDSYCLCAPAGLSRVQTDCE